MPLATAIVVHCPIQDETRLAAFVEECLRDRVSLIAAFGPGCREVETRIDNLIIGAGIDDDRALLTTSHPHDSLRKVLEFAETWAEEYDSGAQQVSF